MKLGNYRNNFEEINKKFADVKIDTIQKLQDINIVQSLRDASISLYNLLKDFQVDIDKAKTEPEFETTWNAFKKELMKEITASKESIEKAFKGLKIDFFTHTYVDKLKSFIINIDTMNPSEIQQSLNLFENFTKDVGSVLQAVKNIKTNIIPKLEESNEFLEQTDHISWNAISTILDNFETKFNKMRESFMSRNLFVYKAIGMNKFLQQTNKVMDVYSQFEKAFENLEQLKKALLVLETLTSDSGDGMKALLGYVYGKLFVNKNYNKEAAEMFMKAHYLYKSLGDGLNTEQTQNEALMLIQKTSDPAEAKSYADVIILHAKKHKDLQLESRTNLFLFEKFLSHKDYETCDRILKEALRCALIAGDTTLTQAIQHNQNQLDNVRGTSQAALQPKVDPQPEIKSEWKVEKMESRTEDIQPEMVSMEKKERPETVISEGPYVYKGTWICKCNNCKYYWEVMDLDASIIGSLESCPKCESSIIEKEKLEFS